MAKIKLTKNELKIQKDALKMYQRYLPTLTLKKQQLQSEIRTIEAKAKSVRKQREELEKGFDEWIAVFSEETAFPEGIITVSNIRKGEGNIAGVEIPIFLGADFSRGDYDLYKTPLWVIRPFCRRAFFPHRQAALTIIPIAIFRATSRGSFRIGKSSAFLLMRSIPVFLVLRNRSI